MAGGEDILLRLRLDSQGVSTGIRKLSEELSKIDNGGIQILNRNQINDDIQFIKRKLRGAFEDFRRLSSGPDQLKIINSSEIEREAQRAKVAISALLPGSLGRGINLGTGEFANISSAIKQLGLDSRVTESAIKKLVSASSNIRIGASTSVDDLPRRIQDAIDKSQKALNELEARLAKVREEEEKFGFTANRTQRKSNIQGSIRDEAQNLETYLNLLDQVRGRLLQINEFNFRVDNLKEFGEGIKQISSAIKNIAGQKVGSIGPNPEAIRLQVAALNKLADAYDRNDTKGLEDVWAAEEVAVRSLTGEYLQQAAALQRLYEGQRKIGEGGDNRFRNANDLIAKYADAGSLPATRTGLRGLRSEVVNAQDNVELFGDQYKKLGEIASSIDEKLAGPFKKAGEAAQEAVKEAERYGRAANGFFKTAPSPGDPGFLASTIDELDEQIAKQKELLGSSLFGGKAGDDALQVIGATIQDLELQKLDRLGATYRGAAIGAKLYFEELKNGGSAQNAIDQILGDFGDTETGLQKAREKLQIFLSTMSGGTDDVAAISNAIASLNERLRDFDRAANSRAFQNFRVNQPLPNSPAGLNETIGAGRRLADAEAPGSNLRLTLLREAADDYRQLSLAQSDNARTNQDSADAFLNSLSSSRGLAAGIRALGESYGTSAAGQQLFVSELKTLASQASSTNTNLAELNRIIDSFDTAKAAAEAKRLADEQRRAAEEARRLSIAQAAVQRGLRTPSRASAGDLAAAQRDAQERLQNALLGTVSFDVASQELFINQLNQIKRSFLEADAVSRKIDFEQEVTQLQAMVAAAGNVPAKLLLAKQVADLLGKSLSLTADQAKRLSNIKIGIDSSLGKQSGTPGTGKIATSLGGIKEEFEAAQDAVRGVDFSDAFAQFERLESKAQNFPQLLEIAARYGKLLAQAIGLGTPEAEKLQERLRGIQDRLQVQPKAPVGSISAIDEGLVEAQNKVNNALPQTEDYYQGIANLVDQTIQKQIAQNKLIEQQGAQYKKVIDTFRSGADKNPFINLADSLGGLKTPAGAQNVLTFFQDIAAKGNLAEKEVEELEAAILKLNKLASKAGFKGGQVSEFLNPKELFGETLKALKGGGGIRGFASRINDLSEINRRGLSEAAIGFGFPFLFGQGLGPALGGGAGGIIGPALLGPGGGFAGGIVGTAIGQTIADLAVRSSELAAALKNPTENLDKLKAAALLSGPAIEGVVEALKSVGKEPQANAALAEDLVSSLAGQSQLLLARRPPSIFKEPALAFDRTFQAGGNLIGTVVDSAVENIKGLIGAPFLAGEKIQLALQQGLQNLTGVTLPALRIAEEVKAAAAEYERFTAATKEAGIEAARRSASTPARANFASAVAEFATGDLEIRSLEAQRNQITDGKKRAELETQITAKIEEQVQKRKEAAAAAQAQADEAERQLNLEKSLSASSEFGRDSLRAFAELQRLRDEAPRVQAEAEQRRALALTAYSASPKTESDKKRLESENALADQGVALARQQLAIAEKEQVVRERTAQQQLDAATRAYGNNRESFGLTGAELENVQEIQALREAERRRDGLANDLKQQPGNAELALNLQNAQVAVDEASLRLSDNWVKIQAEAASRFISAINSGFSLSFARRSQQAIDRRGTSFGAGTIEGLRTVEGIIASVTQAADALNAAEALAEASRNPQTGQVDENLNNKAIIAGDNFNARVIEASNQFKLAVSEAGRNLTSANLNAAKTILGTGQNTPEDRLKTQFFGGAQNQIQFAAKFFQGTLETLGKRFQTITGFFPGGVNQFLAGANFQNPATLQQGIQIADALAGVVEALERQQQASAMVEALNSSKLAIENLISSMDTLIQKTWNVGVVVNADGSYYVNNAMNNANSLPSG